MVLTLDALIARLSDIRGDSPHRGGLRVYISPLESEPEPVSEHADFSVYVEKDRPEISGGNVLLIRGLGAG
jgi:hypothetical protein